MAEGTTGRTEKPFLEEPDEDTPVRLNTMTPRVACATVEAAERIRRRRVRVQVRVKQIGQRTFSHEAGEGHHPLFVDAMVRDAMGTTSKSFADRLLSEICTVFGGDTAEIAERDVNTALAVMDGAKPENEVEAMLVAQMTVTHHAAMNLLARLGDGVLDQTATFGGLAVKLMRTYTAQVDALAKLRRKGEQTVKVVHVYPGGQAVVGDVHNHPGAGGTPSKIEDQPDGTQSPPPRSALPCPDPFGNGVPLTSHAEREMSHSRRAIPGSAEG